MKESKERNGNIYILQANGEEREKGRRGGRGGRKRGRSMVMEWNAISDGKNREEKYIDTEKR